MRDRRSRIGGYRALLYLLPPDLRRDFGDDMARLLIDRLDDASGTVDRLRLRVAAAVDLLAQAALEWKDRGGRSARRLWREGMGMDGWRQDLRFGIRTLSKRPGFSFTAVLTLALGIGATVAIFTVVNAVLLRPLPYPSSEDLQVVWSQNVETGERDRTLDHPDLGLFRERVEGVDFVGYAATRPTLTGFGDPQVVFGTRVTDGLITLMGLQPALGRDLRVSDDVDGGPAVLVVSHSFWTGRLGADPDVLGRTLTLSGVPWEIVGVAPEGFDYPGGVDLWLTRRHESDGCQHGCNIMAAVARLSPGTTVEEAQARLDAAAASLAGDFPDQHRDQGFVFQPMLDHEVADVRTALWVLLGSVGLVLLIACANVANLMLVRASGRRGEVQLRATLGASRLRIIRQLLTESAVLSALGGALGLVFAFWGTRALVAIAPEGLPRLADATIDPVVLGFAGLLVFGVTAVFGVVPALQLTRESGGADAGSRRVSGDRNSHRSRSVLLVAEVALSLTLLLGSGLLIRTLSEMRSVELGFDTDGIERFRVSLPEARYDSLSVGVMIAQIETDLQAIPGVSAAGWSFGVPFASGTIGASVVLLDRPEVGVPDQPGIEVRVATPGFLEATGTALVRGRWFDRSDQYETERVAVINEAAVRAFYADRDPIGAQLEPSVSWGFEESYAATIVGVVADVIRHSPTEPPPAAMYLVNSQFGANTGYFSLRLEPGVATAIPEARRAVAGLDPSLALYDVTTMENVVGDTRAATRFYTTLLSIFSGVALLLAAIGLYGVVAYTASQRTREIGIRIALGAEADDVTGMVIRQGVRPALLGIAVGLVASWFGARMLGSLLFGVTWQDPVTLVGVVGMLLVVTGLATLLPARRAARIHPSSALRAD